MSLLCLVGLVLAGCVGPPMPLAPTTTNHAGQQIPAPIKSMPLRPSAQAAKRVYMIISAPTILDGSLNESAWEGLKLAESRLGMKINYIKAVETTEVSAAFTAAAGQGYDIIWAVGEAEKEALFQAAAKNPKQLYAGIDFCYLDERGLVNNLPNLLTITFNAQENGFLMGYIAAMTSKTKKVGFIGREEDVLGQAFRYGFMAGVKCANKKVTAYAEFIGMDGTREKAQTKAVALYKKGCDILYHAAGEAGAGVLDAAKARGDGKWVIGQEGDQNEDNAEYLLAYMKKEAGQGLLQVMADYRAKGRLSGGRDLNLGLLEGGISIAPLVEKTVSAEVLHKTAMITDAVKAKEIIVPHNKAAYDAFIKALP